MGRKPTSGAEPLSRERILEAALQIVDAQGVRALSMRRVAERLGVDPMALYYHVPSKEALLSGLVERVFRQMPVPGGSASWQERVRAFARAYRRVGQLHPNLTLHLVSTPAAAAAATVEASEALYAALASAGLPPATVVRAADLVVDFVNGYMLGEAARPLGAGTDRQEMLDLMRRSDEDRAPTMHRVIGQVPAGQLHSDFEFSLDVILAGLQAIGGAPSGPAAAPRPT